MQGGDFNMRRNGETFAVLMLCMLLTALLLSACSKQEMTETPQPTAETAEETEPKAEAAVTEAPASEAPQETQLPENPETADTTETPEPEATPEAPAVPPELTDSLEKVRDLIDSHSCYAAFEEIRSLEETYRDNPAAVKECEALFEKLDLLLRDMEPATGTELARTFAVQGGGVLEVNAFNGPALVTVTDAMALMEGAAEPATVRFYVRQGETGQTNLPAGTYLVQYQVGYRWFGPEKGFGEYCTEGMLEEPLTFDFYMDGQWASNAKFTITL